jgi:fructose-bisphosphate aldolase class I
MNELETTARTLVAEGKGILAADESDGTIKKRFDAISVESTEETRRAYRELLFTTEGVEEFVSGVILYDETIRQAADDGTPLVEVLEKAGVVPGIKVDTGAKSLALASGETVTEGLDGLRERLAGYRELGAHFAKWRATLFIGDGMPTELAIHVNAHAMARYAALCQEAGLVPIVEPEVLMDGDHHIDACEAATGRSLDALYRELEEQRIELPGTLLKVNMVLCGTACDTQAGHREVAESTVRCLGAHVPREVPGVVFLSGGQTDEDATARLNEMNRLGPQPWELSFSYGRALQGPSLRAWAGDEMNREEGQRALAHRARMNGLARTGGYDPAMESVGV